MAASRPLVQRAGSQVLLDLLSEGSVTLTAVTLLSPHLTTANHRNVLGEAQHKSKREIEHLVARLQPRPPMPATMRKLPAPTLDERSVRPSAHDPIAQNDATVVLSLPPRPRPAMVTPLAPERYKVQFTVSAETHDKLRRAQDLLRHVIPNGDPAVIFDRALTLLLADLERARLAATARPRTAKKTSAGSRHIPAAVRRDVWKRDGGQCAFVGTQGRCTERGFLEFHHVEPYSAGGPAVVENVALRCRAHNVYEAELYFGDRLPLLVREVSSNRYGSVELGPDRAGHLANTWRLLGRDGMVSRCDDRRATSRYRRRPGLATDGARTSAIQRSCERRLPGPQPMTVTCSSPPGLGTTWQRIAPGCRNGVPANTTTYLTNQDEAERADGCGSR